MTDERSEVLVWDWAIRVFHVLFGLSIAGAVGIAFVAGEHSGIFQWHMLLGIFAGFLLVVRVVLGVVGSRHTRMGAMLRSLGNLPAYTTGWVRGRGDAPTGHNPLAWVVYLTLFALVGMAVWTGAHMNREWAEDLHEALAWMIVAAVGLHLAGIVVHSVLSRENIALSMVTGRKRAVSWERIRGPRTVLGLLLVAASALFMGQLVAAYDPAKGEVRVPWIGTMIPLGENEDGWESEHGSAYRHEEDEHEEDDDD